MRVIIVGASLSGKTTLVKHLRSSTDVLIMEMDEELTRLNGGEYPTDNEHKHSVLAPRIIKDVLDRDRVIFFTNTDYFTIGDLKLAKDRGFKIIQLELNLDQLRKRNEYRVKYEGYENLSRWLDGMLQYQKNIREKGLVDKVVDADQPVEELAKELRDIFSSNCFP